jgi:hypothetical protein
MGMQLFSLAGSGFINTINLYFKPYRLYVCVNKENLLWVSHENFDETWFALFHISKTASRTQTAK